jgi:CheY-like chemotaxis protein
MEVERSDARILVIDSNAHIRRLIVTLLGALAIRDVAQARNGVAAVAMMQQKPRDLVIIDWTVDATDALLFIHRLRRGEFGDAFVPVMALSSSTHHAVLDRAREAGIDEVIAKPISAVDIIQRAGALIDFRNRAKILPAAE